MRIGRLALALLLASWPSLLWAGAAANPATADRQKPMRVAIVRDTRPGCAPTCAEWIGATGRIVPGTAAQFLKVLRAAGSRKLPVLIDSGGGAVADAMTIGRRIREQHLDVTVTRTVFDPCNPRDRACRPAQADGAVSGRAVAPASLCASACVLILAAGQQREVAPWAFVGVHQMIMHQTQTQVRRLFRVVYRIVGGKRIELSRTLIAEKPVSSRVLLSKPSQKTYDDVETYLAGMGISAGLETLMLATPPTSIHWMTAAEERDTRIATAATDGEAIIAAAEHAAAGTAGAPSAANPSGGPERAFLLSGAAGQPATKTQVARVTWSDVPPDGTQGEALLATVEVPDSGLTLALRMERIVAAPRLPFYRITVSIGPSRGGPSSPIAAIGPPGVGDPTAATHPTLNGSVRRVAPGRFEIDLTEDRQQAEVDLAALRGNRWLDLPLVFEDGSRATLAIEHGAAGKAAMDRAIQVWQPISPGVTPPRPSS